MKNLSVNFRRSDIPLKYWFHITKGALWEGVPCHVYDMTFWLMKRWFLTFMWETDYDINGIVNA